MDTDLESSEKDDQPLSVSMAMPEKAKSLDLRTPGPGQEAKYVAQLEEAKNQVSIYERGWRQAFLEAQDLETLLKKEREQRQHVSDLLEDLERRCFNVQKDLSLQHLPEVFAREREQMAQMAQKTTYFEDHCEKLQKSVADLQAQNHQLSLDHADEDEAVARRFAELREQYEEVCSYAESVDHQLHDSKQTLSLLDGRHVVLEQRLARQKAVLVDLLTGRSKVQLMGTVLRCFLAWCQWLVEAKTKKRKEVQAARMRTKLDDEANHAQGRALRAFHMTKNRAVNLRKVADILLEYQVKMTKVHLPTTECPGEMEFHPQPWSLPVPDAGTSTNSTTSSAKSLKLSCKDSFDCTTAPVSVCDKPARISQLVQHVAAQVTAKELAELRTFRNPPAVVCQVLEAVAVILGVSDARWSSMRRLLDNNLLTRLSTLNHLELSHAQKNRLQTLLQVPTFTDGSLLERCPAVASLARWCSAVGSAINGEEKVDLGGLVIEPDLWLLNEAELAKVEDLTVMRHAVGSVTFHGFTDCRELVYCLPDVVVLNPGEVVIYPNQKVKPPVGSGLNKPSTIKLYGCHPKSQIFKDERAREKYRIRVKAMTEEKGAEFIDYDCDQGVWQFRVSHF